MWFSYSQLSSIFSFSLSQIHTNIFYYILCLLAGPWRAPHITSLIILILYTNVPDNNKPPSPRALHWLAGRKIRGVVCNWKYICTLKTLPTMRLGLSPLIKFAFNHTHPSPLLFSWQISKQKHKATHARKRTQLEHIENPNTNTDSRREKNEKKKKKTQESTQTHTQKIYKTEKKATNALRFSRPASLQHQDRNLPLSSVLRYSIRNSN